MIIQIYETTNSTEAKKLAKLGVNHIGILVGKGDYPRQVSFKRAKEIFESLPKGTKKIALTLSNNLSEISDLVREIKPDILHVGATEEQFPFNNIRKIKERFPFLKIMRAIYMVGKEDIKLAKKYEEIVDYLLLDTYREKDSQSGATGETHNWDISCKIVESVKIPVILAGGLGPDNVAEAIKKVKPAGVDSKTKTDRADGRKKDLNEVREFVRIVESLLMN